MRAVWVDLGNDADYVKLAKHGITEPIYDIRDPRVTKHYLLNVEARGFKPGVYAAWNWDEVKGRSGAEFAEWVHEKVKPLHRSPTFPSVHLNDETHSPSRIVDMLERWRELRPTKRTVWTLEGMQGGLFSDGDVAAINVCNIIVGPQSYTGDMTRMESGTVVRNLAVQGFDPDRIFPFLDAAALGYWWEGTAYTQGRLA